MESLDFSGCAKCPVKQKKCDAMYRGSRCFGYRARAGLEFDPKTNAECIRSMDDKTLLTFLLGLQISTLRDAENGIAPSMDGCAKFLGRSKEDDSK